MSDVYLWETYEKVGREAMERRDFSQAMESFRAAVTLAERLPGEEQKLVMSLRHLAAAYAKSGQLGLGYDLLQRTEPIAMEQLGMKHSETVQLKRELYEVTRQLGHLDQAEGYLTEVLAAVRARGETEEFLEVLELLAQLAGERERLDHAAILYKEIADARGTLYGEDHPGVAQALLWHATALSRSGQAEAAEAPLARAFAMLERQFANDPSSLAQSLLAGAELMTTGGRPAAALEHQRRALDLLLRVHDENHASVWDTREMMAATLATVGRLEEAIELLELCLQQRQGIRDHRTGGLLKNLAGLLLTTQKVAQAEEVYRKASEILHETLGADHPATLAATEERIQLYHFSGRSAEALDLALTTIRPTEQRYGAGHPNTAQVYASTAVLAHACQKWETAYELMKAAEAIWDNLNPKPSEVLSNCRLNLATCLVEMGRHGEALAALDKVKVAPGSPVETVVKDLRARAQAESAPAPPRVEPPAPAPPRVEPSAPAPEPLRRVSLRASSEERAAAASSSPRSPRDPFADLPPMEEDVGDPLIDQPLRAGEASAVADADEAPRPLLADDSLTDIFDDFPEFEAPEEIMPVPLADSGPDTVRLELPPQKASASPQPGPTELPDTEASEAAESSPQSDPIAFEGALQEAQQDSPPLDAPDREETPGMPEDDDSEVPSFDPDGDDRRDHRRFNLALNRFFDLPTRSTQGEETLRCFLVDLSEGGLRLNTERPLPTREAFSITLPRELLGEELVLQARVSWQRELVGPSYIQGVKFPNISQAHRERIRSALGDMGELGESGRQHFRLYRPFPIEISPQSEGEDECWIETYASDLSVEGLGTRLSTGLSPGHVRVRLGLEFELPPVEVSATVAWSRSAENGVSHGLRFEEVGPVEARTIRLFLERCLELSPD